MRLARKTGRFISETDRSDFYGSRVISMREPDPEGKIMGLITALMENHRFKYENDQIFDMYCSYVSEFLDIRIARKTEG